MGLAKCSPYFFSGGDLYLELYEHQKKAIERMHNGCILVGGVGSGKSLTSVYYYFHKVCKGMLKKSDKKDLYIITPGRSPG